MIKIITLAFDVESQSFDEEIVNEFVSMHKIRFIRKEFFVCQDVPYWSFVIDYENSIKKKSYEESSNYSVGETTKDQPDEALMNSLKAWRITEAKKQAYPAYIVLTNSQIEDIACKKPMSIDALCKIAGIGKNKISLYGDSIIQIVKEANYDKRIPNIQSVVQHDESNSNHLRTLSEVDEICVEQPDTEFKP